MNIDSSATNSTNTDLGGVPIIAHDDNNNDKNSSTTVNFEKNIANDDEGENATDDDDDESTVSSTNDNRPGRTRYTNKSKLMIRKRNKTNDNYDLSQTKVGRGTQSRSKSRLSSINAMPNNRTKKKPARKTVLLRSLASTVTTTTNIVGNYAADTAIRTSRIETVRSASELTIAERTSIYASIQSTLDTQIGGAIVPIEGEFERIGQLYDVSRHVVSEIWHSGQRLIMDQIISLATANKKLIWTRQQDLLPNFSSIDTTSDVSDNPLQTQNMQPSVEPSAAVIITTEAITIAARASRIKPSYRMPNDPDYDPLRVIEIIDSLQPRKKHRSLKNIAKAANITKEQLLQLATKYPRIKAFKALISSTKGQANKSAAKKQSPSNDNSDSNTSAIVLDDENSDSEESELERRIRTTVAAVWRTDPKSKKFERKTKGIRKQKKRQINDESNNDEETTRTRKKHKSNNSQSLEQSTEAVTPNDAGETVTDGEEQQKKALSNTRNRDERPTPIRPPRKGNPEVAIADKEAVWIILQSKYDPVQKKLPHGLIQRTARQFNMSKSTVGNVWKRGLESIKKQQEDLLGITGIEDHVALATLSVGGKIIRPDVKSRRISNCGRKPVHDVAKISEMLNELPIDQKKSYRQAARNLGVSVTYLLRVMKKHNPEALAAEKNVELTVQLKQQRALRDKVRQEVIRQQKILNRGVSGGGRKSKNVKNDDNNNESGGNVEQSDTIQQPNDAREPVDQSALSQNHETSGISNRDEWTPSTPTNESYWY